MALHSGKNAYSRCEATGSTPNAMKEREKNIITEAQDVMGFQMGYPEKDCWHSHNFSAGNF